MHFVPSAMGPPGPINRRSNAPDDVFAPPPRTISGLRDAIKKFCRIARDRINDGGWVYIRAIVGTSLWEFCVDDVAILTFNGETGQLVE